MDAQTTTSAIAASLRMGQTGSTANSVGATQTPTFPEKKPELPLMRVLCTSDVHRYVLVRRHNSPPFLFQLDISSDDMILVYYPKGCGETDPGRKRSWRAANAKLLVPSRVFRERPIPTRVGCDDRLSENCPVEMQKR